MENSRGGTVHCGTFVVLIYDAHRVWLTVLVNVASIGLIMPVVLGSASEASDKTVSWIQDMIDLDHYACIT